MHYHHHLNLLIVNYVYQSPYDIYPSTSPTHYTNSQNSYQYIDVLLFNNIYITIYKVLDDIGLSDHFPIIYTVKCSELPDGIRHRESWNLSSPHWDIYYSKLQERLLSFSFDAYNNEPNEIAVALTDIIKHTANISIGTRNLKT